MIYRQLGRTDVEVSALCLGTMTFGSQNSKAEGHEQITLSDDVLTDIAKVHRRYPLPI